MTTAGKGGATGLDLVIFDCDGVLVDSEPISNRVLAANLTRHGYPVGPEDCERLFLGGTVIGVGDYVRAEGVALPPDWIDGVYAEIYAALAAGTPLVLGILDLLDRLDAAGVPACVGSNGSREKMAITLGQHGLEARFRGMFTSRGFCAPKPDPALYRHVLSACGVGAGRAVVVEDSPSGARAAVAAGIRCIGFRRSGDGALAAVGAEEVTSMDAVAGKLGL
jgi:HAD superfamily hydrolase (TIGR01509 family)